MGWEASEQATFEVRLSKRDDMARHGHADIVCLESEGLEEIYGSGPFANQSQAVLLNRFNERAQNGPLRGRKPSMAALQEHIRLLSAVL